MVSIGVVALEVLLYLIFIKTLPVLHGDAARR
jgi:Ni/Fe-hydrogenase subunit HybB-like protein